MGLLVLPFLSLKYNLSGLVDSTNSIITIIVAKLLILHILSVVNYCYLNDYIAPNNKVLWCATERGDYKCEY